MSAPHRGFNIFGASSQNPNYGQYNYTINDVAAEAALLNSDTVRFGMNWVEFEPSQGQYNYSVTNRIKGIIDDGRVNNPNLKVMLTVGNIPLWVPGRVPDPFRPGSAQYVTTTSGYSAYGTFCAKILQELDGYAVAIEHNNEPNGLGFSDGTDIPPVHYAGMAAYAAYWIDRCLGPNYYALIGSLRTSGTWNGLNWKQYLGEVMTEVYRLCREFYPLETESIKFMELFHSLRLSIHPYPPFGLSSAEAAWMAVDDIVSWIHSSYPDHKIWLTETGASSATLSPTGQAYFLLGLCYQICGTKPRVEGVLWWPCTDAEGYAWNDENPFFEFGVVEQDGSTLKQAGSMAQSVFGDPDWT